MKFLICLQLVGILFISPAKGLFSSDGINYLTHNFFANLNANLKHMKLNSDSYQFIDRQVNNYVELIQRTHKNEDGRIKKRDVPYGNLTRDNFDVYIVNGLLPLKKIKTKFPRDIMLFKHEKKEGFPQWYAAGLEHQKEDYLVIFRYNDIDFVEIERKVVNNGTKLGLHTVKEGSYIVVAENTTRRSVDFNNKTGIYFFDTFEKLKKIQTLDVDYASDVAIWQEKDEMFMAVTKQMSNTTGVISYETQSVIYKWLGQHFDKIQELNTSGAVKITPFVIGKSHFIAISNRQNNLGSSSIYSEIFKYDLHTEKFISYQKILTKGASDIKVFCFSMKNRKEYFLIVANQFKNDAKKNKKYEVNSIVYKFIDDFFIPFQNFKLNGATEWLPIVGSHGEFALFAACKFEGLKIFQYDGWKFIEAETQFTDDAFGSGILSMNSYLFNKRVVVVVANENDNGQMVNFYQICFREQNELNEYYDDTLKWCKKSIADIDLTSYKEISLLTQNIPKKLDKSVKNSTTSKLQSRAADIDDVEENILSDLGNQVDFMKTEVQTLESQLLADSQVGVIVGDVTAEKVIFKSDSIFNSLSTDEINGVNTVDLLLNVIDINADINLDKLVLKSARIEDFEMQTQIINGHNATNLLHTDDLVSMQNVVIKGNAFFEKGFTTKNLVNTINVTSDHVLLKTGDQIFAGGLDVGDLQSDDVNVKFLNKLDLLQKSQPVKSIKVASIDDLNVQSVFIGGLLNNVDLPVLDKLILRNNGDQVVQSEYIFDELDVSGDLQMNFLGGKKVPDDFIRIDKGDYHIQQDVQFANDLHAEKVTVVERLNQIGVHRKQLDVLRYNVEEMQFIEGEKSFEKVVITDEFNLQAKIVNDTLSEINPVKRVEDEIVLVGDRRFTGEVTVEDVLACNDLVTEDREFSIGRMVKMGLPLNSQDVPMHLDFKQQLNVYEIFVDKINEIDPHLWVVNGLNDSQYIKGWKTFTGDLHITGPLNLITVNSINVPDTAANILMVDGNQTVSANHRFQHVNTESIQSSSIKLGTNNWQNIIENNKPQKLSGTTTIKSLNAETIKTDDTTLTGSFNNISITAMIKDTVFKNATKRITGHKSFTNLLVDNLSSRKEINMKRIPYLIRKAEASYGMSIVFPEDLVVERIKFENLLNNVSAKDFNRNWLRSGEDQNIVGEQFFESLVIFGNAEVESGAINGVNLEEISENSIKIDEEHVFESIHFNDELVSLGDVKLEGHIEDLDIETIVADTGDGITLTDIVFVGNLIVNGTVSTDGLISGFDINELCEFANPKENEPPKNLIISGNAMFVKGPKVMNANGFNVGDILDTAWFKDSGMELTGHIDFNQVFFEDDVNVTGFVDGVDLSRLSNNYLSKTKNQTIVATLEFSEGIIVENTIIAPSAMIHGTVMDVKMDDFVRTVLLDGYDQVFEEIFFVEDCIVHDLQGEFLVNNLNLQTEVMRYDVANIVTGKKSIKDVATDLLVDNRHYKVQNVDIVGWMQSGILKSGHFRIEGRTSFLGNIDFNNGISLRGLLNKATFNPENFLMKSVPQTISEMKYFIEQFPNATEFKTLKLKGYLNNVELDDLIKKQAYTSGDTTFATQLNFNAQIKAKNVNFNGLYQGVNITQLLHNLTNYVSLNNYQQNYAILYDSSVRVRNSLSKQAHFLSHYKIIMSLENVDEVYPVNNFFEGLHLITSRTNNGSQLIDFLRFDAVLETFALDPQLMEIKNSQYLTYVAPLEFDFGSYIYVENEIHDIHGFSRMGNLIRAINATSFEITDQIPTNGTKVILPLQIEASLKSCILMAYDFEQFIQIYCAEQDGLKLYQQLAIHRALTVTTLTIKNCVYIIAIDDGSLSQQESSIVIWKHDVTTGYFNVHQRFSAIAPNSITAISHNGMHYLAIGSGHLENTLYPGQVHIKRFDESTHYFTSWQQVPISAPIQIVFAELPSKELILYVLCDSITEALVIYKYEGISKFTRNTIIASLPKCYSITPFTHEQNHFVVARAVRSFPIIRAIFKGSRYNMN